MKHTIVWNFFYSDVLVLRSVSLLGIQKRRCNKSSLGTMLFTRKDLRMLTQLWEKHALPFREYNQIMVFFELQPI